MDISRLVKSKPSPLPLRDGLIARAARSWNPEFPGRMELPQKYAKICLVTMVLATSKQRNPMEILPEVCRIKGVDESEVIEALKLLARRIEDTDYAPKGNSGMEAALIKRTKSLLERLR
ncbi:MAG: hypothetical protein ACYDHX_15825 [Methanothrix sp.]